MPSAPLESTRAAVEGTLEAVDPASREIVVRLDGGGHLLFYLPLDCPILLRKERVKLRLLQPHDRVRIRFVADAAALAAQLVCVG
jgi:hypothetical protein